MLSRIDQPRSRVLLAATLVAVLLGAPATHPNIAAADDDQAAKQLARALATRAGVSRGICTVLGRDGDVAIHLAATSQLLVHVREPNAARATQLQELADEAGLGIDRLVVSQGGFETLPLADNMADVLIVTNADNHLLEKLSIQEVLRVLRPDGRAIIGKALRSQGPDVDLQRLYTWAADGDVASLKTSADALGMWASFSKPLPPGLDDWSHWEKGPDNNPVSDDAIIRAPYMTQFMADPLYIGMPSITTAAGGRTFLAIGHISHHRREWNTLNKLIARNGYNGIVLWERKLPEGYMVHRSAFIASKDTFHMIDGDRCLLIDPESGRDQGEIRIPELKGDWKWMVLQGDVLYVLAGQPDPDVVTMKGDRTYGGWSWADLSKGYYDKRIPFGFGDTLAAYDVKQKKTLWIHQEETLIDSRGMALRDGQMYLYCPDRHLRALDAGSGEVVWTNGTPKTLNLIEEPGKGLVSTPGFRTACLVVATPDALIVQGQTRNNVVAISTRDGYLLWTKRKFTNNPNAIFLDGQVILGVGERGSHVAIDPLSGDVQEDLKFLKRACTRLTASGDSLFCRGDGMLRFDRETKKVLIDGAQRPACNDGAMPANGLLYLGPWQCDCNLSLIGNIAKCSAGEFRFDHLATEAKNLQRAGGDTARIAPFEITAADWPTYRANNDRGSGTSTPVAMPATRRWQFTASSPYTPTAPVAAGGLLFTAGSDGKVRAFKASNGALLWQYRTGGVIKYPPTIWEGRALLGSGDGWAYCLEAATGRLLWRFRAAPVERDIMVYGSLSSTWPVHSGVLVHEGVAYLAAGIIDHDGTYVYALDAKTGKLVWQNNATGHLSKELRKGVSVQGNLSIVGDHLLLASGNQVSPAQFELKTGRCLAKPFNQGQPKSNNGRFVGVFHDGTVLAGGRILHSDPANVSNKNSFLAMSRNSAYNLSFGGIPPAWGDDAIALVNFKQGQLTCVDAQATAQRLQQGYKRDTDQRQRRWQNITQSLEDDGAVRWQTDLGQPNKFEAVSLAVCPNAIVGVVQYQQRTRAQPEWWVVAFDAKSGRPRWRQPLADDPLPGGLLVDRDGRVVVTMLSGNVLCLGAKN